jgi:hypothetical protein
MTGFRHLSAMCIVGGMFAGPAVAQTAAEAPVLPGVYRAAGASPDGSRYRGMAAIITENDRLRFTWWIGTRVFSGIGQAAGHTVTVEWGEPHPVVYTFGTDGSLDGKWADGRATDRLELFARAAPGQVPIPDGRYRTNGQNPNGTRYTGTVSIVERSGQFEFGWQVGASRYRGTGKLDRNLLTVDWGSAQPIVYALGQDGGLRGLWADGQGEDILTPDR